MDVLTQARWSPYAVGIGIGVLSWFTFLISGRPIACSTSFAKLSGIIERAIRGPAVEQRPYFRKIHLVVGWQMMLVVGVVIGSFLSAMLSGSFDAQWVPSLWEASFGDSTMLRLGVALLGGVVIGFGARWAGGCTSGHGISGTMQLALSSWIAAVCFFAGGIVTAHIIFSVLA